METAIISGKGGTGKSCIAAAFATLENSVVLADCDVDAANLYILFNPEVTENLAFTGSKEASIQDDLCDNCGICMEYCRFNAISVAGGRVTISEIFCDGCGLCAKVCPREAMIMKENRNSRLYSGNFRYGKMVYGQLAPGEENSGKLVSLVRTKARLLASQNNMNIILDGPPGIGCPVISSISGVDKVVIVTEPSMSGLHDLKRIGELCKPMHSKVYVIINKYDLYDGINPEVEAYCHQNGFALAGKIPYNKMVVEAMIHCKTIVEWAPDSNVAYALDETFNNIFNTNESPVRA